jgi:hypothetical protein
MNQSPANPKAMLLSDSVCLEAAPARPRQDNAFLRPVYVPVRNAPARPGAEDALRIPSRGVAA